MRALEVQLLALSAALGGCGSSVSSSVASDAGFGDAWGGGGAHDAPASLRQTDAQKSLATEAGGVPDDDCASGTDLIYVVSQDTGSLYSFYPPTLKFTSIGKLACEATSTPFAMSVDRSGTAWVLYGDGNLFHVSTADASCTPTSFVPAQHGFSVFGMGFSADSAGSSAESLFVCWTEGLARIDPTSLTLTPVGSVPGIDISSGCDLTGTGGGALYSFITQPTQWVVAQLDKTTSAPMWQHPVTPPIPAGGAWGTSFWGGDLYLYTGETTSSVWQYDPTTDVTKQLVADVGFLIVGAGESTCVPTTAPIPH